MEKQDGNQYLQIVTPGVSELRDGPVPAAGRGQAVVRIDAITTCPHWRRAPTECRLRGEPAMIRS